MHKKTIFAIVAVIAAVCAGLLATWVVAPSLKIICQAVQISSYAYLIYYWFWGRPHSSRRSSFLEKVWRFYSLPLQIVGWLFIFAGVFMTLFAFSRIFDKTLQGDKSGDWEGAGMSCLDILLGIVAIKISKRLNSTRK